MSQPAPLRLRVADLPQNRPTAFEIVPTPDQQTALAAKLGIDGLRKLRFEGALVIEGKTGWRLDGHLGATVVQPCVVTLAPVTTRIDETVTRRFLIRLPEADMTGEEIEMPEDDTIEQLGPEIDLEAVMEEAIALALPLYPRADGAALAETQFTEAGRTPMSDDEARPFAGLKNLLGRDD